jgi:pimeloyl-ACP methyl ester carboxylesterase
MHQGTSAMLRDVKIMTCRWEFDPRSISIPVQCWHGRKDTMAPYKMVEKEFEKIRDCHVNLLEEETHWLLFRKWNSIIAALIN